MRKKLLTLTLALALLCGACGGEKPEAGQGEDQVELWFLSGSQPDPASALGRELRPRPEGEDGVAGLMELLLAGPESPELKSPFPGNTQLKGWSIEGDQVTLDLSEAYGGLSEVDLSLADGCIVLTLCQLPEVRQVYLTVEGRPRPFRDQVLSADDFLLETGSQGAEGQTE